MSFVLGFGSTEKEMEIKIINECHDAIRNTDAKNEKEITAAINLVKNKYKTEAENNDKMNRDASPERYTYFHSFAHEVFKGRYYVDFVFMHINRNHALSPDGWALLETEKIMRVSDGEMEVFG